MTNQTLQLIDDQIKLNRRRLSRLQAERNRALSDDMDCLSRGVMPGPTGMQLAKALKKYIAATEDRIHELETQRQKLLLRRINELDDVLESSSEGDAA